MPHAVPIGDGKKLPGRVGWVNSSWKSDSAEQRERKQLHKHLYQDTWNVHTCNLPFFRPPPGKIISLKSQLQKKVIINLAAIQGVDEIFLCRLTYIKGTEEECFTALGSFTEKALSTPSVKVTQTPSFLLFPSTHLAASQWE